MAQAIVPRVVNYVPQNHRDALSLSMIGGQSYLVHTNRHLALEVFGIYKGGPYDARCAPPESFGFWKRESRLDFLSGAAPFFYRFLKIAPGEAEHVKAELNRREKPNTMNLSRD